LAAWTRTVVPASGMNRLVSSFKHFNSFRR
jgi:hypothetical protein